MTILGKNNTKTTAILDFMYMDSISFEANFDNLCHSSVINIFTFRPSSYLLI